MIEGDDIQHYCVLQICPLTCFSSFKWWTCPPSTTASLLSDFSANRAPPITPSFFLTMVTCPKLPCPKKSCVGAPTTKIRDIISYVRQKTGRRTKSGVMFKCYTYAFERPLLSDRYLLTPTYTSYTHNIHICIYPRSFLSFFLSACTLLVSSILILKSNCSGPV